MAVFDAPPNLGTVTTKRVLEDGAPILMVSHDADDGGWQFLCGTTNDPKDGRIVCLADIVSSDPSVCEVADLPVGWVAFRDAIGSPWKREPR